MRAAKRILALWVAAFLLLQALPVTAQGDNVSAGYSVGLSNVIYDQDQLYNWCNENEDGGTVFLGCDVTLTGTLAAYGTTGFITIDTGENSLILDRGNISLHNYRVVGRGVEKPVLDVHMAYTFRSHWSGVLFDLKVTATGDGERGGTAVRVRDVVDTGFRFNLHNIYGFAGDIRAYGENARGVVLEQPGQYYCFNVAVEGDNSVGVEAQDGTELYFSRITAIGANAKAVNGSDVVLDTCVVSPSADGAAVRWSIPDLTEATPQLMVEQFYDAERILSDGVFVSHSNMDGIEYISIIEWDFSKIDTSQTGIVELRGRVTQPFDKLGLEDYLPMTLQACVWDAALPCINMIQGYDSIYQLYYWLPKGDALGEATLWRSTNNGETWANITNADSIHWETYSNPDDPEFHSEFGEITVTCEDTEETYMFAIDMMDGRRSNIAIIKSGTCYAISDNGGDRTGTDHGGGEAPADPGDDDPPDDADPDKPGDDDEEDDDPPPKGDDEDPANPGDDDPPPKDDGKAPAVPITTDGTRGSGSGSNRPDIDPPKAVAPVKQEPDPRAEASISPVPRTIAVAEAYIHKVPGEADSAEEILIPDSDTPSITLSGERIAAMIAANPQRVTFIVDGVRVLVNSGNLLALGIREDQLFTILLEHTDGDIVVRFLLDGVEVVLPYELPTTTQEIQANTKPVSPTQTDLPAGPSGTPFLPLVAGVVPVGAVSAWLCRKRLIKR